ncbi:MAG: tetratricopeptide repeat protein [Kofleriaceae bacterium]
MSIDAPNAFKLLEYTCTSGEMTACAIVGGHYLEGTEHLQIAADVPRALALLHKACDHGDSLGCWYLADEALSERGGGDREKGRTLYSRACAGNDENAKESCAKLAELLDRGAFGPRDAQAAFAAYKRACERGHDKVCVRYGGMLALGDGVQKDAATARTILAEPCRREIPFPFRSDNCRVLGDMLRDGVGGPKDITGAIEVYELLCPNDPPRSSSGLATLTATNSKDSEACTALARLRPSPPKNRARR